MSVDQTTRRLRRAFPSWARVALSAALGLVVSLGLAFALSRFVAVRFLGELLLTPFFLGAKSACAMGLPCDLFFGPAACLLGLFVQALVWGGAAVLAVEVFRRYRIRRSST
jgi:hypothetical protein